MDLAVAFPAHLLVAEPFPDVLTFLQAVLEGDEGYTVTKATSLPAALAALEEHLFHLVLTDLFLTSADWHDPLQSIRPLLTRAAPTPVGVLTAWDVSPEAVAKAGLAFLLKKFDLFDFLNAISNVVQPMHSPSRQAAVVIKEFFAALNSHDWKRLERLCMPDIAIVPLSVSSKISRVSPSRLYTSLSGMEQFFLEHLFLDQSGFAIEDAYIYPHPLGIAARYLARWQGSDGHICRLANALYFRFQGERIAQIKGSF